MTYKKLLSQLNDLKNIRPPKNWLESNREILLSQISNSGATELSYWQKFKLDLKSYGLVLSRPAMVMASLFILFFGLAAYAHLAFNNTRPNDSLYIAKKISEKAKLNTVFNSQERNRLEAQFAANHAEGIIDYLAETKAELENGDQRLAYSGELKKELNIVREKLALLVQEEKESNTISDSSSKASSSTNADDLVSVAESGKDEQGTQIKLNEDNDNNRDHDGDDNRGEDLIKETSSSQIKTPIINSSTDPISTSSDSLNEKLLTNDASASSTSNLQAESELNNLNLDSSLKKKTDLILETEALIDSNNFKEAKVKFKELRELIK